ncbi:MAG: helix-turn-helix domain-containing protein [Actinomycetota bacterium]
MATEQVGSNHDEVWVTAGVAAEMLGVVPGTIRRYAQEERISHTRTLGGQLRFRLSDLEAVRQQLMQSVSEDVAPLLGQYPVRKRGEG